MAEVKQVSETKKLIIPAFKTEAEETDWLYRHRRQLEAETIRRIKEGSTFTLKEAMARWKRREKARS